MAKSTPPPPGRSSTHPLHGNEKAYQALDHKAKEITRVNNGFQYLYSAARFLPRLIGTFIDYDTLLTRGIVIEVASLSEDQALLDGLQTEADAAREELVFNTWWEVHTCFPLMHDHFPGFKEHIPYLRQKPDLVSQIASFMHAVSNKARSDDAGRLKKRIMELVPDITEKERAYLKEKTRRGFCHTKTGRLLCPIAKLEKFDEDPEEFCREVRDRPKGGIRISSFDWPMCLYDMTTFEADYDPDDDPDNLLPGFLRSELLAYKYIFTGVSTTSTCMRDPAMKTHQGRPSIARAYGFEHVTIFSILYTAVLVRWALNSQYMWNDNDADFKGNLFVRSILTVLIRDSEYMEDLLEWWDQEVFRESGDSRESEDDDSTTFARLLARDKAKRARTAEKGKGTASRE
ncbi:hypothetical protein C8Q78DRAFT_1083709 [Trametes maxima]|nr:hypothetical protein C8Q78DRAFT_1083709 [Trametes maxima]